MSEGWKQVWQDVLSSLRGETESEAASVPPSSDPVLYEETRVIDPTIDQPDVEDGLLIAAVISPQEMDAVSEVLPVDDESISAESRPETAQPETQTASLWQRIRENAVFISAILVIGGILWLSSRGSSFGVPQPPAPDVIATFDGGQITIADLEEHLTLLVPNEFQEVTNSPHTLELVVQDMVTDELARQWAAERQPDDDETFAHTMEHITEEINLESFDSRLHENSAVVSESEIQDYYYTNRDQFGEQTLDLVRDAIRQTLLAEREQGYIEEYIQSLRDNASITRSFELLDVPAPSEDDLRRYYIENTAQYIVPRQVTVDELEFPIGQDESSAREQADNVLLSIRSGATFEQIAQENTNVIFTPSVMVPEGAIASEWEINVFDLTEGEISDVFRAGNSFHIVRVSAFEEERTLSFEEMRGFLIPIIQQEQTDIWFQENANRTLFTINGQRYTAGQFYQEYQEIPPMIQAQFSGTDGMRNLAEQLIERLLLVEDTYDQLLDAQNQPLTDESRLQVLKQMLHQENVDDQIEVTDDETQQFYNDNLNLMVVPAEARIRYIRIGLGSSQDETQRARARADEAYNRLIPSALQTGEDFATIAQEYSEDPETAAHGGEFPGWIGESADLLAETELHPFHERVLTLQPNEISPVFEFGDSFYIVQVIERTDEETLSFDEAQPYIQEILFQQEHETLSIELENSLLEQAEFTIYPSVLETYLLQNPTPNP